MSSEVARPLAAGTAPFCCCCVAALLSVAGCCGVASVFGWSVFCCSDFCWSVCACAGCACAATADAAKRKEMTATLKRVFERPAHIEPPANLYGCERRKRGRRLSALRGLGRRAVRREACFAALTAARASTVVRGSARGRRGDFLFPSRALYCTPRGARNKHLG